MLTNVNKIMNVVLDMDVECTSTNHNSNDQRWLLQINDCLKRLCLWRSAKNRENAEKLQWRPPGRESWSFCPTGRTPVRLMDQVWTDS